MSDNNYTARTWFLTIPQKSFENMGFGIPFDQEHCEDIGNALLSYSDDINYKIIGTCCYSQNEFFHLHVVITSPSPVRLTGVSKKYGNAHVEPMRGLKEQSFDYIRKQGKFANSSEDVLYEFGTSNSECISNNSVSIDTIANDLSLSLDAYFVDNHIYDRKERDKYKCARESYCKSKFSHDTRDINVIWICGQPGSGKSHQAFSDIIGDQRYFRASVSDKTSFPFNGYDYEPILWLDELRPGVFKPQELFQLFDIYPLLIDVKNGQTVACWTTIVISSTFPLCEFFKDDGVNNYDNLYKQLIRRISDFKFPIKFTNSPYFEFYSTPLWDYYKNAYVRDDTITRIKFDNFIRHLQSLDGRYDPVSEWPYDEPLSLSTTSTAELNDDDLDYIQTNIFTHTEDN